MAPLGSAPELEAPRGAGLLLSPPGLVASPASAKASPLRQGALPLTPPPQPGLPVRAAPVAPVVRHVQTPPPSGLQPGAPADGALTSELTCCAGSPAALSTTPKGPSASPGSRHMVVEVDAIARIVLPEPDGRAACGAPAPGDAPAADRAAGQALAEASAGVADFVPRYNVCVNPLCRRKWKQLTPKVLPLFCPPCKRSLEDGIPGSKDMPEATLTESMCERWRAICTELAQILGGQDSAAAKSADAGGDAGLRLAEGHIPASSLALWSSTLSAFAGCFPVRPDPEDVRNWNSVHSRRKHFRGVIHRCRRRFVCILEAQEELEEDLRVSRRALQGAREYPVLDWHEDLSEGQEVLFIAFPNPSVRERDRVSRIVRLLNAPEGGAASENKPAALAGAGGALGDSFKDSFADLVEWSTQQPSEDVPEADSAAAARPLAPAPSARAAPAQAEQRAAATPLSLEAALLLGAAITAPPPPRPIQSAVPPLPQQGARAGARAGGGARGARGPGGYPAHSAAFGQQQPQQQPAAAPPRARWPQAGPAKGSGPPPHSPPFKSPFPRPARSPFVCPRSPYATYFDD